MRQVTKCVQDRLGLDQYVALIRGTVIRHGIVDNCNTHINRLPLSR